MTETSIAILIKRASLAFDKAANNYLPPYGLTNTQFKTLKYLYRQPDLSVTQRQLEAFLDMTNLTVTGILQNLEKNEFISRQQNPQDARSKVLGLTEKSLAIQSELIDLGTQMYKDFTHHLSESEKNALALLLTKLMKGNHHADTN